MVKLKSSKSLLRYPGGKSRGAAKIFEFIEKTDTKEICSPFLGGGSVELMCANNGMRVFGYDKFEPLVDFWNCLIKKPDELAQLVAGWWSSGDMKFEEERTVKGRIRPSKWVAGLSEYYEKKDTITKMHNYSELKDELSFPELSQLERAALFYVINRTSFSGSALSGGVTAGNPRFTESSIHRILEFKDVNTTENITVECLDFTKSIEKNKQKLMYLDPPYWLDSKLYGEKGDLNFQEKDHLELFKILSKAPKWILSYNDSEIIRETYRNYEIVSLEWAYGMKNYNGSTKQKKEKKIKKKKTMPKSSEVLILKGIQL